MKYAKLARPRMHKALPRQRLFDLMDELCQRHPVIWVAAPPGAGKTTLAAGYLADSSRAGVWCQLDEADADPATLFFFLDEALKELAAPLAAPAAGVAPGGVPAAQSFFRAFYARLPAGAALVLDNVQDFDWDNAGALLEVALNEAPAGINVFALSREPPPHRLSRLELSGQITTIGWQQLRLTDAEALELAELHALRTDGLNQWLTLLDGWAAGLVMLRNLYQDSNPGSAPVLDSQDAVFRYFAGEILDRMPAESQQLLLLLSCLPGLSRADAEQLSGSAAASLLLEQLYHKRLFVERRGEVEQTYHFHALFRSFLQLQARQRLDPAQRTAWLARAGDILERRGRLDEAAQLYQEAHEHGALVRLLNGRAADMLAAGRGHTWREWMSTLPPGVTEAEPTLWYWHGVSLNDLAPGRARQILVRAARAFRDAGQQRMLLLAITAIIDSYDQEWSGLDALPGWIEELQARLPAAIAEGEGDPVLELRLHTRLMLGLLLVTSDSPLLAPEAQRALQILAQVDNAYEKLSAGAILLRYLDWTGATDMAQRLVGWLGQTAEDPAVSAWHRVWWYGRVARWYNQDGQLGEAERTTDTAKTLVANYDLDPLLCQFLDASHLLGARELEPARLLLNQIRDALTPSRQTDWLEFHALDMRWHALAGDIGGARRAALAAIALSDQVGLAWSARARTENLLGALYALEGDVSASEHWYEQAERHGSGHDGFLVREARQLVQAWLAAGAGDERGALALLRPALAAHRQRQSSTLFVDLPRLAAAISALAFRHEIEVDHLRDIVLRQQLSAPERSAPNWPWPVAVRTLGNFELRLAGKVQVATGKAQQRPLMLLKALVSGGTAGRTQKALWAQLWPDGEDPKSALNVTVHRLRKLVQGDELVTVTAGAVQLAEHAVWSDVAVLAELCNRIDGFGAGVPVAELEAAAVQLLDIYRGSFCDGEEEAWVISAALRWQGRFLHSAGMLGLLLEQAGRCHSAVMLYQRALDAEPLAESLYRGVMRCAMAQSDPGAALGAYRRCKQMLSVVAGRAPSAETEALARQMGFNA